MLFNSYEFIFLFLPVALLLFHGLRCYGHSALALDSLVLCSLIFYGWWNPVYLGLICPLAAVNFLLALAIARCRASSLHQARLFLIGGVTMNLLVLGYFKYMNFIVDNLNDAFGLRIIIATIILPLGISFFTFQKIAFLVDVYKGKQDQLEFRPYLLFVLFFPQ